MRVVALLATYNEERFIAACLEHLRSQGVDTYLIDNASTDATVAIAERYLGKGVVGIEHMARDGTSNLRERLERKQQLAATLDADWFMHVDADEFRLPPRSGTTLADALAAVDARGYNAVDFVEFVFVPTRESPEHDHRDFQRTMRWYYPYVPLPMRRLNAWKRQPGPVNLVGQAGHVVDFPGVRPYPRRFPMRHYLFLSRAHAIQKYARLRYEPRETSAGWHGWRARLYGSAAEACPDLLPLPSVSELRCYTTDDELDARNPRTRHTWLETWVVRATAA